MDVNPCVLSVIYTVQLHTTPLSSIEDVKIQYRFGLPYTIT